MTVVKTLEPPPSANVVALLETYLERAKSGEICQIAIVGMCRDGGCCRGIDSDISGHGLTLLGGIEALKNMMMAQLTDQWGIP